MTHPTKPITVTSDTFHADVLHSDIPVLVDIWAPWCGPCRVISPIVEDLAQEFAGRAKVAKLNSDDNADIANQYQVQAIPTLLIFENGQLVDRIVGLASKASLASRLNQILNKESPVSR